MPAYKICTINTWKNDGDYNNRMRYLAACLQKIDADIICLQECFVCEELHLDTLKFLADLLAMNLAYVPGRKRKREHNKRYLMSESGLGVLTKHKIVNTASHMLPVNAVDDDRKMQQAEIQLPNSETLLVTNVHFTHITSKEMLRMHQAEYLAEKINSATGLRQFICGDFNATPVSYEIKALMAKAGLTDCFEAVSPGQERCSLVHAFETGKQVCVDHIFLKQATHKENAIGIEDARIVLNEKDAVHGIYPSDHFGICVQFNIGNL